MPLDANQLHPLALQNAQEEVERYWKVLQRYGISGERDMATIHIQERQVDAADQYCDECLRRWKRRIADLREHEFRVDTLEESLRRWRAKKKPTIPVLFSMIGVFLGVMTGACAGAGTDA